MNDKIKVTAHRVATESCNQGDPITKPTHLMWTLIFHV
jgi:hypothetical protein